MKQYREDLKNRAQKLRKQSTDTEKFLWKHLRNKQITGIKFRRQQPVGKYIVDFISCEMKIIIEVDGGQLILLIERKILKEIGILTRGI